jgi:uncharacterized membrane protein
VIVALLESRRRSIAKALSWRILASIITALVALALTGKLEFAIQIGLLDTTVKLAIYYLHERLWQRVRYGKMPAPDYEV